MSDEKAKNISNYPGNSHKEKEQLEPKASKPKVEKVIRGEVVQRKRPLGKRIAETFTGEDMHSVGHYILFDVLIPAAKTMISDAASQGVERMLFGDSRPRSSGTRVGSSSYTSYNRYHSSSTRRDEPVRTISQRARANHDFGEVVLASRGEAEEVIDKLVALIDQYDVATVSDLYDMVGITGSFTDDKWGWYDLRGAGVRRIRDGYLLDLPRTTPIE